eukprot:5779389-Pyramimonas_sp.AAC.1
MTPCVFVVISARADVIFAVSRRATDSHHTDIKKSFSNVSVSSGSSEQRDGWILVCQYIDCKSDVVSALRPSRPYQVESNFEAPCWLFPPKALASGVSTYASYLPLGGVHMAT